MKKLFSLISMLLCIAPVVADRYQALTSAKHLTLVTRGGDTYYYILSSEDTPMMRLGGETVVVERDTFSTSNISQMRLRTIPRFLLDEDSLTFGKDYAVDHGLLALRRSLVTNQWNSIVLPVELTGQQVREAFGQDALVAQVRAFRENDNTVVEYETIDLDTRGVVMLANMHYIIRPTREPDLAAGRTGTLFGTVRPKGPLYLIHTVSMDTKQTPKMVPLTSDDKSSRLVQRGTYTLLDGSSRSNAKVAPSIYYLNEEGHFEQPADSVTVKAFSSWFTDLTQVPRQLLFYVDGVSEYLSQIEGITADSRQPAAQSGVYSLMGRKVAERADANVLRKGIYIIDGKKIFVK